MTRRLALVTALAALVAALSLTTAASASANIVFQAPANNSASVAAPTVTWEYVGTVTTASTCTLEFNSSVVAGPGICQNAPFNAVPDASDIANIQWTLSNTNLAPFFSTHGDGEYKLTVGVDFTVGGPTASTLKFVKDTVVPSVAIQPLVSFATKDDTPEFTFVPTDATALTYECSIAAPAPGQNSGNVGGYSACASPFVPASPLADGTWNLYVRATDLAGNQYGYDVRQFTVDTEPPAIIVTNPVPNQVMETPQPVIGYTYSDPLPSSGVEQSAFKCAYDSEPLLGCFDPAFLAKTLPHGPHTLRLELTDNAGNFTSLVIPFSVDTDLGADPPTAGRVTFKKKSGKRAGRNYKLVVTASFAVPEGLDPATACKGKVRLSITGRLRGKKSKTYTKQPDLQAVGRTCVATGSFTIPRAYKGKRLTTKLIFRGNTVFGGFQRNGSIKKA